MNEVYAHAVVGKHPHVVRYYSAWAENDHMYIQDEYCNGMCILRSTCSFEYDNCDLFSSLNIFIVVLQGEVWQKNWVETRDKD